jgi:ketosteroid isomerase-like protein
MPDAAAIVRDFWTRMARNDFASLAPRLADDFTLEWPQSNERIRGGANFIQMNREYPAAGPWTFNIVQIIGAATEAVSHVIVSDGVQTARAISFFTLAGDKIVKIVEFWPDPYDPPANRRHLVEPLTENG